MSLLNLEISRASRQLSIGPSRFTDCNVTVLSSEELMHHGTWRVFELKFIKKRSDINEDQQTSVWTEMSDFMITCSTFTRQSDSDPLHSDFVFVFGSAVQMSPVYVPLNDYMIHTLSSSVQTFNIFQSPGFSSCRHVSGPVTEPEPVKAFWAPLPPPRVTCAWQLSHPLPHCPTVIVQQNWDAAPS